MKRTLVYVFLMCLVLSFCACEASSGGCTVPPFLPEKSTTTEKEPTQTTEEMVQEYIDDVDLYLAQCRYDEAMATLDTAEQIFGTHQKITKKRAEIKKSKLLNTVALYEEAGEYRTALDCISNSDDSLKSDPEIIQKNNLLKITYKNQCFALAQTAYDNENYDEASSVLHAMLTFFPEDAEVMAKIEEYTPVLYMDLAQNIKKNVYKTKVMNDSKGNIYKDQLWFLGCYYNTVGGGFVETYIEQYPGGKYSKFKATIVPHESMDEKNLGYGATFKIYADERLIYTSPVITRKSIPVNVDIDIAGTQYLKCQLEPTSSAKSENNEYSIILADAKVYR